MDESEGSDVGTYDSNPPEWACYTIDSLNEELAERSVEIFDQFQQAVTRELHHSVVELTSVYRRFEDQFRMTCKMRDIIYPRDRAIFWITVNPDPTKINIRDFVEKIRKLVNRACFHNTMYAFEQTGDCPKDMGKHPHVHILCDKTADISPAQMQKYIYSSVKHICGNIKSVHVQVFPPAIRADKEAYLRGEKWEDGKLPAVGINTHWRVINDISQIYICK